MKLQQCLPLAVLKPYKRTEQTTGFIQVATVLTACGIETFVATLNGEFQRPLQQCLPLAVLKLNGDGIKPFAIVVRLQQCLPLAVLKPSSMPATLIMLFTGCNSAYRLRY